MKRITSLDTETVFQTDIYSVSDLGNFHYCQDPRFECYLVSISRDDGFKWTGHPKDCPWEEVFGEEVELVSHHRPFDQAVIERMYELGLIPKPVYESWFDTAPMSVFAGAPRSLAGASEFLLKKPMNKNMRSYMSGKRIEDLPPAKQEEMRIYAQDDADNCLELWLKHGDEWPEHERWLAAWTSNIPVRGIPVNVDLVNAGVKTLSEQRDKALAGIPWYPAEPPLSKPPFNRLCEERGIPAPKSMAKDSEDFQIWLDAYSADHPFVECVRNYRRINTFCSKLETIQRKLRGDRFLGELLYMGAVTTGRWSGTGKYNLQNMPRDEMFGVNMRNVIRAPDGYMLAVADSSQIEPRCLGVLSGNTALIESIRSGYGVYEAFARSNLNWTGGKLKDENSDLYRLSKAMVLGLGFKCGAVKFVDVARIMANLDVLTLQTEEDRNTEYYDKWMGRQYTPAEVVGKRLVDFFRKTNPLLAAQKYIDGKSGFWEQLDLHARAHAGTGQTCFFELPSGRVLRYFDVQNIGGLSAITVDSKTGKMGRRKIHGGILCENVTQGNARDVIGWQKRQTEESGIPVLFSAHDELVCLVPEKTAERDMATVLQIMHTAPPWMPTLPVAAEGSLTKEYTK